MRKYMIERNIPAVGKFQPTELREVARKSVGVLQDLGPAVQWVQSYITRDRMYCVYLASDESLVREHALRGGFPADQIHRITSVIDPSTAE
jgi:Nickel responsive protein SCO4226-like